MKIRFHKYQGTGNDFIILDNRDKSYDNLNAAQVQRLCDRRFGIGADGLMLFNLKEGYDFEMVYFNADGNKSTLCGNGSRCIVKFASTIGIHKYTYNFLAADGQHEAEIDIHHIIRVHMQDVNKVEEHAGFSVLNTGSPHFVKFADNVKEVDVFESGRAIRYSKAFQEEGINVNFVEAMPDDEIYVRTYERGVEDETLSCGTGVVASALLSAHNDKGFNRVQIETPGGKLSVEFNKIDDTHFENIWLCGPASFVFSGEIEIN
jgi:diaminopimelate epimerase